MEPDVIKSLYYMYKRQIIQFYKLNKGGSGFSESFVYAIAHDCYPYFHVDDEVKIYAGTGNFDAGDKFQISVGLEAVDGTTLTAAYNQTLA